MVVDHVEQAIQRLTEAAGSLTLDQRLRIAALLARPAAVTAVSGDPAPTAIPAKPRVLTVEETAEVLKVGRSTVYDLIRSGLLTSIMIGRLRRIRYTDLLDYLHQPNTDHEPTG